MGLVVAVLITEQIGAHGYPIGLAVVRGSGAAREQAGSVFFRIDGEEPFFGVDDINRVERMRTAIAFEKRAAERAFATTDAPAYQRSRVGARCDPVPDRGRRRVRTDQSLPLALATHDTTS